MWYWSIETNSAILETTYEVAVDDFDEQYITISKVGIGHDDFIRYKTIEITFTNGEKKFIAFSDIAYLCNNEGKTITIYKALNS